jgi:hypothetical protein
LGSPEDSEPDASDGADSEGSPVSGAEVSTGVVGVCSAGDEPAGVSAFPAFTSRDSGLSINLLSHVYQDKTGTFTLYQATRFVDLTLDSTARLPKRGSTNTFKIYPLSFKVRNTVSQFVEVYSKSEVSPIRT